MWIDSQSLHSPLQKESLHDSLQTHQSHISETNDKTSHNIKWDSESSSSISHKTLNQKEQLLDNPSKLQALGHFLGMPQTNWIWCSQIMGYKYNRTEMSNTSLSENLKWKIQLPPPPCYFSNLNWIHSLKTWQWTSHADSTSKQDKQNTANLPSDAEIKLRFYANDPQLLA